ncbi:MAG: fumarylacetoacetate hydrolase family protein [Kiritimatiellae bacterium]|nr:fumarylacetoacetate hydrolase family protein [Kiritimatiellia bacterium]
MKLVRYGEPGRERPGLWLTDRGAPEILDVRGTAFDIADYDAHFFTHWGIERLRGLLLEKKQKRFPAAGVRLGPPVATPTNLICVGKNYADHATEFDSKIPAEPVLFAKSPSALIGAEDPIHIPPTFSEVDAEAELAIVIGAPSRNLSEANALEHIAGYTLINDVTERRAQREAGQWFRGKSFDTFAPIGPHLVTPDEIPDPQNLRIRSRVNGTPLQDGNTRNMLFPLARILAYISSTLTLQPGDIIATGTPSGVGFARTPPVLLRAGDTIEMEIESIGSLKNPVR